MNKLNISLHSIDMLSDYENELMINGYYIGNDQYALRQAKSFSLEDIGDIRSKTGKQLFVVVNKLIHNHEIAELEQYLIALDNINVDFVVFSDFAVYQLVRRNNLSLKLMYATETTITNKSFTDLADAYNIDAIEVAHEITLKETKEICEQDKCEVSLNIHGHMYMYQSVRNLLSNYKEMSDLEFDPSSELFLYDEERDKYFPIIENSQGTHLLASNDLCLINHLDKVKDLKATYLKIDGFGYMEKDFKLLINIYINALKQDAEEYKVNKSILLKEIKELIKYKSFDSGFSFKETMY